MAYLGVARGESRERAAIAELLWPSADFRTGAHSLSQLLYSARQALSPGAFELSQERIRLTPGLWCHDIHRLEQALEGDDWRAVVDCYRTKFMKDFSISRSWAFEQWLDRERISLHRRVVAFLKDVVAGLEVDGDWKSLEALTSHLSRVDPLNPFFYEVHARALAAEGKYAAARDECTTAIGLIERELNAELALPLYAVLQRIDAAEAASKYFLGAPKVEAPFIGRSGPFRELRGLWEEAKGGQTRICLIEGDAGIGKTRFSERIVKLAALQGARVLTAKCLEGESRIPFATLLQILRGIPAGVLAGLPAIWRRALWTLIPAKAEPFDPPPITLSGEGSEARLLESLGQLFRALLSAQPVVVLIDDVHWADEATVTALGHIVCGSLEDRLLVILTARHSRYHAEPLLRSLFSNQTVLRVLRRIELLPLDPGDSRLLVSSILESNGRCHPEWVEKIVLSTGGNPFLLVEAAQVQGHSDTRDGSTSIYLSESAEAFLRSRLEEVSEDARLVLQAAAISNRIESQFLSKIVGVEEVSVLRSIDELLHRGVLVERGDTTAFAHDLFREVAYADLAGPRRKWLHGRVALLFLREGSEPPSVLAQHFAAAGSGSYAAVFSERAAEESERLSAPREREFFLRLALQHIRGVTDRARLSMLLADHLFQYQSYEEATAILTAILSSKTLYGLSDCQELAARTKLLEIVERTGEQPGVALAERIADLLTQASTAHCTSVVTDLLAVGIRVAHDLGDRRRVALLLSALLEHANAPGCPAEAQLAAANCTALCGNVHSALRLARRAAAVAGASGKWELRLRSLSILGVALHQCGRLAEAQNTLTGAVSEARECGAVLLEARLLNTLGVIQIDRFDFNAAEESFGRVLEIVRPRGDLIMQGVALVNLGIVAYERENWTVLADLYANFREVEGGRRPWILFEMLGLMGLCHLFHSNYRSAGIVLNEIERIANDTPVASNEPSHGVIFISRMKEHFESSEVASKWLRDWIREYRNRSTTTRWQLFVELAAVLIRAGAARRGRRLAKAVATTAAESQADLYTLRADALLEAHRASDLDG